MHVGESVPLKCPSFMILGVFTVMDRHPVYAVPSCSSFPRMGSKISMTACEIKDNATHDY